MDTTNRYAPPGAQVDDVAAGFAGYQPVKLWPADGRLGRLRWLAYNLGLYVVFIAVFALVALLGAALHSTLLGFVPMVLVLLYFIASIALAIQRSHDMNLSGWWTIAMFIPLVGLIWVFKGGSPGVNRFGAPPPPNGLAVKILGLMLPAVFVIGIVAAIALPAYSDYARRAQAVGR